MCPELLIVMFEILCWGFGQAAGTLGGVNVAVVSLAPGGVEANTKEN